MMLRAARLSVNAARAGDRIALDTTSRNRRRGGVESFHSNEETRWSRSADAHGAGWRRRLKDLAEAHDLSIEGVRRAVLRAARQHIDKLVLDMWASQKEGQLLILAVPSWADPEGQRLVHAYLDWLLGEFDRRDDVKVAVRYRPAADGAFCFTLEDTTFNPTEGGAR